LWFTEAERLNAPGSARAGLNRARAAEYTRRAIIPVRAFRGKNKRTSLLQFSADNRFLLRSAEGFLELYDLEAEFPLDIRSATAAAFLPGVSELAVVRRPGLVEILSLPQLTPLRELRIAPELGPISGIGFSPNHELLFVGSNPPRLWDTGANRLVEPPLPPFPDGQPCFAAFTPDLKTMGAFRVDARGDALTLALDQSPPTWQVPRMIDVPPALRHVTPARRDLHFPDGASRLDRLTQVVLPAGLPERRFAGYPAAFSGAAISPDGALLATATQQGILIVWRAESPPSYRWIPQKAQLAQLRPVFSPGTFRCVAAH
jgi:WD40 repeat protein